MHILITVEQNQHNASGRNPLRLDLSPSLRKSRAGVVQNTGKVNWSLSYQDSNAALALVSARPNEDSIAQQSSSTGADDSDPEMKRAKDLLELQAAVKVAQQDGTNAELNEAREAVRKVLETLR